MSFSNLHIGEDGRVSLNTRIFMDDLSEHLQAQYGLRYIDFSSVQSRGTQTLEQYLAEHLYFLQNGRKITVKIHSAFLLDNEKWVLAVESTTNQPLVTSGEVYLVNTVLCDASQTQTNNVKYLDRYYKMDLSNPKVAIRLN